MFCPLKFSFNFAFAVLAFFRIPLLLFGASWASFSSTNLVLCTKILKATLSPIPASNLVASSFGKHHKLPVVSE